MKRIEVVITPWTLDAFKEAAPRLGISEFDVVEVYRSGCAVAEARPQLYRGREFRAELLSRLRLEFLLFDDAVQPTLHQLLELVHPESVAVFKLDQEVRTISATNGYLTRSLPSEEIVRGPELTPRPQIIGFVPRRDGAQLRQESTPPRSDTPLATAIVTDRARI